MTRSDSFKIRLHVHSAECTVSLLNQAGRNNYPNDPKFVRNEPVTSGLTSVYKPAGLSPEPSAIVGKRLDRVVRSQVSVSTNVMLLEQKWQAMLDSRSPVAEGRSYTFFADISAFRSRLVNWMMSITDERILLTWCL